MIQETYTQIIDQLKENIRPRVPLSNALYEALLQHLDEESIPSEKVLCILCHLASPEQSLGARLIKHLDHSLPHETQIFILEAIQKHILDERMISGDRLKPEFLKAFADYLSQAPKQTLYFAVGIVESCGSQAIFFRKTIKSIKWGFLDAFKKEYRETIERIDALEKRWQNITK